MDDFLSQIDAVIQKQNNNPPSPQQEKPEPVENDFIKNIDTVLKSQPSQEVRMAAARDWAAKAVGSEKQIAGIGVRDFLENTIPLGSSIWNAREALKHKEAKEAYYRNEATDEQLGVIAKKDALDERKQSFGLGRKIVNAAMQAPAILGEAYMAGGLVSGGAKALGAGGLVEGATSTAGKVGQFLATQTAATPAMPVLYVEESIKRSEQNGGHWTDPKNVMPPLVKAAVMNNVLGTIGKLAGNIPGGVLSRIGVGAAAMPIEQAGADVLVSSVDKAMEKAGIDKKWQTDTKFGVIGTWLDGHHGDAMQEVALQAFIGGGMAAFHGGKPKAIDSLKEASDKLADAGIPPEQAGPILKDALTKPPESLPAGPIRDFVEEVAKSNQQPDQKAPETPKQPIPDVQTAETVKEPVKQEQGQQGPLDRLNKEQVKELAKSLGIKESKLRSKESEPWVAMLVDAAHPVATAEPVKSSQESISAPEGIKLGQAEPGGKTFGGQELTRHTILDPDGQEIGHVKVFQSGETLNLDWMGAKDAGATDKAAKGSLGTKAVSQTFEQLAMQYPDAKFIKYINAEGRINAGKKNFRDLEAIRNKIIDKNPALKEERDAAEAAIRAGNSPESVAETIRQNESQGSGPRSSEVPPSENSPAAGTANPERAAAGNTEAGSAAVQGVGQRTEGPTSGNERVKKEDSPLWKFADKLEDRAKERMKKKFGSDTLFSGFDPEAISVLAEFTAAKIIKAGLTFAEFSKKIIDRFGDAIKPHIADIWKQAEAHVAEGSKGEKAANDHLEATSIKNATVAQEREARGIPQAEPADPVGHSFPELKDQVNEIAAKDPARIDKLVEELQKKPRPVTDLEDAMLLRKQVELQNSYEQTTGRLEEARKTGDPATIAEAENAEADLRSRLEQLYDVNKAVGTESGRGLAARKMLMKNDYSLARMTIQKQSAKGSDLTPKEREQIAEQSKKIADLQKQLDDLKAEKVKKAEQSTTPINKPPTLGRTEAARAEVDKAWEDFRKVTKGKLFSTPGMDPEIIGAAAKLAKAYIKLGGAKLADFIVEVRNRSGKDLNQEEMAIIQQAWGQAENEVISEKRAKVEEEVRKQPATKEEVKIEAQLQQEKTEWKKSLVADERAKENYVKKAFRVVGDVLDLQRAIKLGGDLPPIFRQGGFVTAGHPILSAKSLKETAKSFKSEIGATESAVELAKRENAQNGLYKRAMGMDIADIHGQDEFLKSSWIKKIPLFSNLERWHSSYLTRLRADYFDALTSGLSRTGKPSEAEAKIIGNAVNVFTGRGNIGSAEQAVGVLNRVFLAPKWVASRFQVALGQPIWHGIGQYGFQPRARVAIAKEYLRSMGGLTALYGAVGLGIAAGLKATIEPDPRSSDFMEIKMGNTRINPLFGLSQVYRFMAQLVTGQKKKTDETKVVYNVKLGNTLSSEFRKKLAPLPSTAWTAKEIAEKQIGQTSSGPPQPYAQNWGSLALDSIEPLTVEDFRKAAYDLGLAPGIAVGLLGSLGSGVKVYSKP